MDEGAVVLCPYCGQENAIALDWGGASQQEYEEDCQVCCRPWLVKVVLSYSGEVQVSVDRLEE